MGVPIYTRRRSRAHRARRVFEELVVTALAQRRDNISSPAARPRRTRRTFTQSAFFCRCQPCPSRAPGECGGADRAKGGGGAGPTAAVLSAVTRDEPAPTPERVARAILRQTEWGRPRAIGRHRFHRLHRGRDANFQYFVQQVF